MLPDLETIVHCIIWLSVWKDIFYLSQMTFSKISRVFSENSKDKLGH